jgi:hypothetical protein
MRWLLERPAERPQPGGIAARPSASAVPEI